MALARSVCGALCVCVLALLAVLGVLAEWPAARQQFFVASHTKLEPDGVLFKISNTLAAVACFVGCRLDYIGCVKPMSIKDTAAAYGWEPGEGISITPGGWSDQSFMSVGFSHAAYKRVAHNPAAGRSPDMFIMSNISKLPVGVIPEGVAPSVLNFNTGHPEHSKRRSVMAEVFTALGQHPTNIEIIQPPQLSYQRDSPYTSPWHADPRAITDILGYNLFHLLFGVQLSADELTGMYEYDGLLPGVIFGVGVGETAGARLAEIRAPIEAKVFKSKIGRKFLSKAKSAGLSGGAANRLKEMIFIAMFAGYGGTGTLCRYTVQHILKDPAKNLQLWHESPSAFVLEAARLYPSVAGMNPFLHREASELTAGTGRKVKIKAGDLGIIHSTGANLDPSVFENPETFRPGRANAERLMTWNNELSAIRSCPTAAGCPAAPRGCPGTHLAIHLTEKVVGVVVRAIEDYRESEGKVDL